MGTRIVFTDKHSVEVKGYHPADLAQIVSGNKGMSEFAGNYWHATTTDGEAVWINPASVAYLEQVAA